MTDQTLPHNCPMRRADYNHYCPSESLGMQSYQEHGQCYRHNECVHLVKEFKRMHIEHTSDVVKRLGI